VDSAALLITRLRAQALLRAVAAAGGFGTVLAHGDDAAGSLAIVTREQGLETLLAPVLGADGRYGMAAMATGDGVARWIGRARGHDPDLWVIELDIPQAGQFVAAWLASA
jgi:hypothetical protein